MRIRPSNRERSMRTLALLDIRPEDAVLEIGFGPGLAIEQAAKMASSLRGAGFENVRIEILEMAPVNAACVLGQKPSGGDK